jgi:hypothetical protein
MGREKKKHPRQETTFYTFYTVARNPECRGVLNPPAGARRRASCGIRSLLLAAKPGGC